MQTLISIIRTVSCMVVIDKERSRKLASGNTFVTCEAPAKLPAFSIEPRSVPGTSIIFNFTSPLTTYDYTQQEYGLSKLGLGSRFINESQGSSTDPAL